LTDSYPSDTSWTLFNTCSGGGPIASDSGYTQENKLYSKQITTIPGRFKFDIFDSFDDGICCSAGDGEYKLFLDSKLVEQGDGKYGTSDTKYFGAAQCGAASSAVLGLARPKPLVKPLIICSGLGVTSCKAAEDVCEWREDESSGGGIFSLRRGLCYSILE